MACLSALVVLVLVMTAEAYVGNSIESRFCNETKECLLYDHVCRTEKYEVRHYNRTKWVSTNEKSMFMELAKARAFTKLFQYITGSNEQDMTIDMTAPVVVKMRKKSHWWQSSEYTVSFLLPSAYQESPPTPNNSEVYFTDMPDMNVYVRSFGKWMFTFIVNHHSEKLKEDLDNVKASYQQDFHYAAGYNGPMKFLKRHNEVWYQAVGEPVCPQT